MSGQTFQVEIVDRPQTMAETLPTLKECSLFSDAMKSAGLDAVLGYGGQHTLFAPADSALDSQPLSDLYEYVNEHLMEGAKRSSDLTALAELTSFSGHSVPVESDGGTIRVGGDTVQRADVQCTNGVIHVVGRLTKTA